MSSGYWTFFTESPQILDEESTFTPENLLQESRRQKKLPSTPVPSFCALDPDGDIVKYCQDSGLATLHPGWACYHTKLWVVQPQDSSLEPFGLVGCAVGSSFAVLIAEQLFASGCKMLVSMTSAGLLDGSLAPGVTFVFLDKAVRGEGTSYHYLPASISVDVSPHVKETFAPSELDLEATMKWGTSWTTDAPYRETPTLIKHATAAGASLVEMECSALYAFAQARGKSVLCIAQLTNAVNGVQDFEKGQGDGAPLALKLLDGVQRQWRARGEER